MANEQLWPTNTPGPAGVPSGGPPLRSRDERERECSTSRDLFSDSGLCVSLMFASR